VVDREHRAAQNGVPLFRVAVTVPVVAVAASVQNIASRAVSRPPHCSRIRVHVAPSPAIPVTG